MKMNEIKSGFVHVLGQTNVGKSTLINKVMGKKITITSEKPQTTRNRIRCVCDIEEGQIVFLDTPGLHKPIGQLGRHLQEEVKKALEGSDLMLYLVEPWGQIDKGDRSLLSNLNEIQSPKILLINKIDKYEKGKVKETLNCYKKEGVFDRFVPISALKGTNLEIVMGLIIELLPSGPRLFPEGIDTDQPTEFLISEFIREKVYQLTYEEVPYSVAVEAKEVNTRKDGLVEVFANIFVARKSQKGILIGRGGEMIKKIGEGARKDLERLLGAKVFLDLKVKVSKKWNTSERKIKFFTDYR